MADDITIQQCAYCDDWHPQTKGNVTSLEGADSANPDLGSSAVRESWQAGGLAEGNPRTAGQQGDQTRRVADINLLQDAIHIRVFDLTGDGRVDPEDREELVSNIHDKSYDGTDLDRIVNHIDFERLAANCWSQPCLFCGRRF